MKYEEAIKRIEYLKNKAEIALNNNNTSCEWLKKDVEGTITAFSMAIDALQKQATSEWIPVSERLPENIKTVLVTLKEMEQPTIGWYGNIDGWRLSEKEFCCIEHEVIAWMPLPPVFKGE